MASITFNLQDDNKVESTVSGFLSQARAQNSNTVNIVCDKGGDALTKTVLSALNTPNLKKMYTSCDLDTKNRTCVVVRF